MATRGLDMMERRKRLGAASKFSAELSHSPASSFQYLDMTAVEAVNGATSTETTTTTPAVSADFPPANGKTDGDESEGDDDDETPVAGAGE